MSDLSWGELHKQAQSISKHSEHDQKSHGSWANGRGGGSGRSGIKRIRPGAEGLEDLRQALSEARRALFTGPNMSESKRRAYAENVQRLERQVKQREKELREKS